VSVVQIRPSAPDKYFMRSKEITGNWHEPTLKSVRDSVSSLVPSDPGYSKTYQLVKNGTVKRIPYSYFLNDKLFEPYTKKDLADKDLDPRVKQIVKGFKSGTIPMVLATINRGKIHVYDGFTRAGVAIALGLPIYAKVVQQ
jgi:hypothetical protein